MQHLIAFCSRPDRASDVISDRFVGQNVRNEPLKFCDDRLNRSRDIPLEAVGGVIFDRSSNVDNVRPEVASDVMYPVWL